MLKRQGMRAAFGALAVVFALSTLVLLNLIGWQLLRLYVQPIYATLILLGINLAIAIMFAVLAARSLPTHAEREALRIRQDALQAAQGALAIATLVPLVGKLLRSSQAASSKRWLFGARRIR
jgi:cobalamin biosynthesis protein CobD/CbiB